ncbi:hypothetical protein [Aureivirga sp. CE67]|uniref:exodeoxyribonuclease X C-terminal domain-containing protein n=1 Tax=Aureivirga sp. CE67 TaxID=1788983 RepID=UPI0018C98AD2|nr:hypothetical protein [Aureivirga sp. CE67]
MKFYNLYTIFTFGSFKNKILKEVLETQPSYVEFCIKSFDHFYISDKDMEEIKEQFPDFLISEEGQELLLERYKRWKVEFNKSI